MSWIDENDDVFLSDFRSVVQHSPIHGDAIQQLCDQDDTKPCLYRDNRNTTSVDGNGTKPCPYRDDQDGRPDIGNVLHQVIQVPIYTANCTAVRLLETDI